MAVCFDCRCGRSFLVPAEFSGRRSACPGCGESLVVPHPDVSRDCPACRRRIEPPPKRGRKCPHCAAPFRVRKSMLMTEAEADAFDAEFAAEYRESSGVVIDGKVYTMGAGGSADALRRGIENGTFSGFREWKEGEAEARIADSLARFRTAKEAKRKPEG